MAGFRHQRKERLFRRNAQIFGHGWRDRSHGLTGFRRCRRWRRNLSKNIRKINSRLFGKFMYRRKRSNQTPEKIGGRASPHFSTIARIPDSDLVDLQVLNRYDLLGHQVRTLVSRYEEPGYKSIVWNATNNQGMPVSAGMYLYSITADEFRQTRKMLLLK